MRISMFGSCLPEPCHPDQLLRNNGCEPIGQIQPLLVDSKEGEMTLTRPRNTSTSASH